jgi:hypothetical protein
MKGLSHLINQVVSLNINGNSAKKDVLISGDELDFRSIEGIDHNEIYSSIVGYTYKVKGQTVPFITQSPIVGSTLGLSQHQKAAYLMLYRSLSGSYGSDSSMLFPIEYRRADNGELINNPEEPFTGTVRLTIPNSDINKSSIYWEQEDTTPFNVICITPDVNVSDEAI